MYYIDCGKRYPSGSEKFKSCASRIFDGKYIDCEIAQKRHTKGGAAARDWDPNHTAYIPDVDEYAVYDACGETTVTKPTVSPVTVGQPSNSWTNDINDIGRL